MRIEISASVIINRSPSDVFASLIDLKKWPEWGGNLVSMEQISAGSLQVGSQIRQVTKGARKSSESILEVTEYVPDQGFGIKGRNLDGAFRLEQVEAGTRLNAHFEVEADGLMALMYKLMLKRFVMSDLRKFKTMIESTEVAGL